MYGWPPGYNKANSAVLLRQLVPQHVLPPPSRTSPPPPPPFPFWLLLPFHRYPTLPTLHLLTLVLSVSLLSTAFFHALEQPNIFIRPLGGVAHVRLLKRFHPEEQPHALTPPSLLFLSLSLSVSLFFSSFLFHSVFAFFSLSRKEKSTGEREPTRAPLFEYLRAFLYGYILEINRRGVFNLIRTGRECFGINVDAAHTCVNSEMVMEIPPFVFVSRAVTLVVSPSDLALTRYFAISFSPILFRGGKIIEFEQIVEPWSESTIFDTVSRKLSKKLAARKSFKRVSGSSRSLPPLETRLYIYVSLIEESNRSTYLPCMRAV